MIAFADVHDNREAAGLLLALFAGGSVLGGLAFGGRSWPGSPTVQLAAITAAATVAMAPLAVAGSLVTAGLLAIFAGAPSAAQWAAASLALDRASGGAAGAEAFTWLSSANAVGVALGSVVAGALVEASGTPAAFLAGCAATALATAFLIVRRSTIE
jgi:predicted MFS family arabinose efflux permease